MPQATCYVLDLDDTLYPERDYVRSGFRAVDSWLATRLGLPGFGDACWQSFAGGRRGDIFDAVLESRYGVVDAELVSELVAAYRAHQPRIEMYPDADRFLDRAHRLDLPLALITDGPPQAQRAKLDALAPSNAFSPIVVTAELGEGRSKPHAAAYELVQETLGFDRRYVYIADNPLKDFFAPNQLGWSTIRVQRPDGIYSQATAPTPEHEAQQTVTSLDEI